MVSTDVRVLGRTQARTRGLKAFAIVQHEDLGETRLQLPEHAGEDEA
ncbi:hypothetical protein [Actinomadura rudentiformis]|nr:hypothetical protein [Actinomadura rudentiformis]